MKFIATTSDKMSTIPIVFGQLIFSRDDRVIYLDTDVRTSFQQIMTLVNEEQRRALTNPIPGFYFVRETKMLWSYEDSNWAPISGGGEVQQQISFGDKPTTGEINKLYVDNFNIYQWDNTTNQYVLISSDKWGGINNN